MKNLNRSNISAIFRLAFIFIKLIIVQAAYATPKNVEMEVDPLSPAGIYKLIESSKRKYSVNLIKNLEISESEYINTMYPKDEKPPIYLEVLKSGQIKSFPFSSNCHDEGMKAYDLMEKRNRLESIAYFDKILRKEPNCYLANIGKGHALFYLDRIRESIVQYEKAIEINPVDYQGYFYAANNHLKLKNLDKAYAYYVKVLSLYPNHLPTSKNVKANAKKLNVEVSDLSFNPKGLVRMKGDDIQIFIPQENSVWSAWLLSKAAWLGESNLRKKYLGFSEYKWSTFEEVHCLTNLINVYQANLEEKKEKPNFEFDNLTRIAKEGYLKEFTIYFMGSRLYAALTLTLSPEQRVRQEEFVKRYLLIRKK